MAKQRQIIGIQEKVPLSKGIPLSIQHTFAMFSASVLVPYILGINPSIALLMNGIGTFIFIISTKGRAPAYLGSSFAFISPALLVIGIVDFSTVGQASVFELPAFQTPQWSIQAILIIIPATLVVVSEHIGHQVVTSEVVGKDLLKDPGLHRSMFADGFSTALSGFCGSCPTTTYGENIGVMAITKVYSVWVIGGAAAFSIILSFIGKASALIQTIPGPVMGGVSFLLYGMIGASGIRLMVDAKIDYSKPRNLAMTSVVFVVGLSGIAIKLGSAQLSGMSLAAVTGMILGLVMYLLDKFHLTNEYEADDSTEAAGSEDPAI